MFRFCIVLYFSHVSPWSTVVINCFRDILSISPESVNYLAVNLGQCALSTHLVVLPFTYVLIAVCENLVAHTFDFVVFEVTLVLRSILPNHDSLSMHAVLLEFAFVDLARLSKEILSFTVELPINEVSLIDISIEFKFALACLLAIFELSSVNNLVVFP